MMHRLVDDTLVVERNDKGEPLGILAHCVCGWKSRHFTSMSASAAFQGHKEQAQRKQYRG